MHAWCALPLCWCNSSPWLASLIPEGPGSEGLLSGAWRKGGQQLAVFLLAGASVSPGGFSPPPALFALSLRTSKNQRLHKFGFVKRGFFSSPWAFLALQRFQFQRLHVTPVETRQRAGAAFAFCLTASSNLSPSACGSNYRGPLQCYEDRPTPSF